MLTLRMATSADAEALVGIYREYIDTPVTFEYTAPSVEEFAGRIEKTLTQYPWLVCEEDGVIIGYAYASRHRERAAYGWNASLSIYLTERCTGRRIGARLYGALLELLRRQNIINVYAAVTDPNPSSHSFHRAEGFEALGTFRHTGYKNGRWYDVVHYEKQLSPLSDSPAAFIPIGELDAAAIEEILARQSA